MPYFKHGMTPMKSGKMEKPSSSFPSEMKKEFETDLLDHEASAGIFTRKEKRKC